MRVTKINKHHILLHVLVYYSSISKIIFNNHLHSNLLLRTIANHYLNIRIKYFCKNQVDNSAESVRQMYTQLIYVKEY